MSGGSVCVLAPNGRRQTVKCSPNTTILQILEEVCKKQQINPEEFDLKHHKTVLDTTVTFRFSGLPNNAQLEMVPVTRTRCESNITLAVNLEDGTRMVGDFLPDDTLLNVLNKLCPESLSHEKAPVVVYTRREIYGEELEKCSLRSLGLTSGRAMVRVLHKFPEELKTQAAVAGHLPSKPVEEKPYHRTLQRVPSPPRQMEESKEENIANDSEMKDVSEENKQTDTNITNADKIRAQKYEKNVDILKLAREKRKNKELPTSPKVEKKQNLTGSTFLKPEMTANACECKDGGSMEVDCDLKCLKNCSNTLEKPIEAEFIFLGSRNAMLFSLESAQSLPTEDLPDDFFELTIEDARRILRDVKKQSQGSENAPLLTAAMRNLEDSKKQLRQLSRYKKAIIRIQFADRIILQGVFAPTDTIANVMEFVREFLDDSLSKFYLYSTPPKCILDENKRLIELGFVPNALIHFGLDDGDAKAGNSLKKEFQNKFTSNSVASLLASKIRTENMRNCPFQEEDTTMEVENAVTDNFGPSTSGAVTYERKVIQSSDPVPKWFKG